MRTLILSAQTPLQCCAAVAEGMARYVIINGDIINRSQIDRLRRGDGKRPDVSDKRALIVILPPRGFSAVPFVPWAPVSPLCTRGSWSHNNVVLRFDFVMSIDLCRMTAPSFYFSYSGFLRVWRTPDKNENRAKFTMDTIFKTALSFCLCDFVTYVHITTCYLLLE